MKKQKHNVHGEATASAPRGKGRGYVGMVCEHVARGVCATYPSHDNAHADDTCKTEGEKNGSVVGCNANNSNVSARTANCNNHAGNGNNNYAGAFAVNTEKGKPLTSGAASSKTKDGHVATGGHGRCDYGSELPFWDSCGNAESNVSATVEDADVMEELKTANKKRKLKNLRRFFVNRTIIEKAFDRTMERTSAPDSVIEAWTAQKQKVCDRIERELREKSYTPKPSEAKAKEGKEGYMVRLTYIHLLNGQKRLCHSTEGSEEIVEFFRLVVNGTAELHQRLHVKHDGTKVFFDEYHTTKQEACELICAELGI